MLTPLILTMVATLTCSAKEIRAQLTNNHPPTHSWSKANGVPLSTWKQIFDQSGFTNCVKVKLTLFDDKAQITSYQVEEIPARGYFEAVQFADGSSYKFQTTGCDTISIAYDLFVVPENILKVKEAQPWIRLLVKHLKIISRGNEDDAFLFYRLEEFQKHYPRATFNKDKIQLDKESSLSVELRKGMARIKFVVKSLSE